jgi:type I restriction enzyme S subunit
MSGKAQSLSEWPSVSLSSIATLSPGNATKDLPDTTEVTFIPMAMVQEESGRIEGATARPLGEVRKGYTAFREGDILFAKITPCMENGKIAIARGLKQGIGFGSTEFHVIRPGREVDPEFLRYFLVRKSFRGDAREHMTGSAGQLRVARAWLEETPIPFPSLPEQRAIVAKIEALFSDLDKGRARLETARARLATYRQAVLKAAYSGQVNRRMKEVAEICTVVRGGSPRPAGDKRFYGGEIPFLKVADITSLGKMHITNFECTITKAGLSKTRMVEENTLLLTNNGATLGVPAITTFKTTFNDGVAAFLGLPETSLKYHYYFWQSKTADLRRINQGAAQPNLNTSIIGHQEIPDIDDAGQSRIVSDIESRLSLAETLGKSIDEALRREKALRQAILKKAFEGRLLSKAELAACVPQSEVTEDETMIAKQRTGPMRASLDFHVPEFT